MGFRIQGFTFGVYDLGFSVESLGLSLGFRILMENQIEKNIEHEMEAGIPFECWWRINTASCLMNGFWELNKPFKPKP